MAGDWIKMRGNLWDDPRIAKICDLTDQGEAAVVGGLYWLWATADQHSEDGIMHGLTLRQIDRKTGIQGFGDALVNIGWLAEHAEGVRIVRFEDHNGISAKKRCQTAKRVAKLRTSNEGVTLDALQNEHQSVNCALAREREEKSKEQTNPDGLVVASNADDQIAEQIADAKTSTVPNCPQQALLDLYAECLPELPQPRAWEGQAADALRTRWRWVLTATKRGSGERYATTAAEGVEWFRRFFGYVAGSDFLMGRKADWQADLRWLVKAANFDKVLSGAYENGRAAA